MDSHIQKILEDIFELDPTLKSHEPQIMGIVEKMTQMKPDTKFDEGFRSELEAKIRKEIKASSVKDSSVRDSSLRSEGQPGVASEKDNKKSLKDRVSGMISYLRFSRLYTRYTFAALAVLLVGFGSWWFFADYSAIPGVIGANFSLEYHKLPYNVKSLDISFSTKLDADTVSTKTVSLVPFVKGEVSLEEGNVIRYKLAEPLKIGEKYTLTVLKSVASSYGKEMAADYYYNFEAVAGAKATKILPSRKLDNLSANIVVLFNIPVVPLTSLSERDKLPCPVTIQPKIEGKCKWTSPSVLEYIPNGGLSGATEYHVKVADKPGLLYPLSESLEGSFTTPELEFTIGSPIEVTSANVYSGSITREYTDSNETYPSKAASTFSPAEGLRIRANFPVDKADLASHITLEDSDGKAMSFDVVPVKTEDPIQKESESRFTIVPKGKAFVYDSRYLMQLKGGIKPKYGNMASKDERTITLTSNKFYDMAESNQRIYSATGEILNTRSFTPTQNIATKNMFFNLTFEEEVTLNDNNYSFQSVKGDKIPFELSYIKEKEILPSGQQSDKMIENKKRVQVSLKKELAYNTEYKLIISKAMNKNLREDVLIQYKTAPKQAIKGFEYLSNTEICVYLENDLYPYGYGSIEEVDNVTNTIKIEPKAIIRNFTPDRPQYPANTGVCPTKSGLAYLLNVRLNPKTKYTITLGADLPDMYGNPLGAAFSRTVTSGELSEKDKYIYTSLAKEINIIPNDLPIVMNLQSINLDKATVEVCEMDLDGYKNYLTRMYDPAFQPSCVNTVSKILSLKNNAWYLTPNKFDVEKDILGTSLAQPFVLVRGSTDGRFQKGSGGGMDSEREFRNVFARQNLSVMVEKAANKTVIFASSFDGKAQPADLAFEAYTSSYTSGKQEFTPVGNLKAKWNAATKTYVTDKAFDLLIAKNATYFGVVNSSSDLTSNYDFHYISGQDTSTKEYLYIYPDRPLYKPGDTVFFKGLLRNFTFDGYKKSSNKTGKIKVADENGTAIQELTVTLDKNSNFNGKFILPANVSLGRFHFEYYTGDNATPVYNDGHFFIEEYKKPTFKVNLDTNKKDAVVGDGAQYTVSPEYYFGGKVINTTYAWSVLVQNYFFDAKSYGDYQFGEGYEYYDCLYWGYCNFSDQLKDSGEGKIGATGTDTRDYVFPSKLKDESGNTQAEKIYNYNVTVTDPDTKKTVSKTVSTVLHTTDGYVGVKAPYWIGKDDEIDVHGVVLDYDAKPLSGKSVTIELIKQEWKDIKKQGVDGVFYNEYGLEETKEDTFSVSSDANGEWSKSIKTKAQGEYKIVATYTGKNGQSFSSSRSVYIASDNYISWNNGNNTTTDLTSEKNMLKVGETANFTLKSPVKEGKVFVAVEKDDGILDFFVQDVTSYGQKISLPIKANYYPNIYIKAFVIGKEGVNPLPVYKRALGVIKVITDDKKLSVTITPAQKTYLPGQKIVMNVVVKDDQGNAVKGANGSIAVVDESLLALKGNPKKNPFAFFYEMKRYLGVDTYISLTNLIEKLEVKDVGNGEKGGAGEGGKGGLAKKKRGVFKDTAYWLADFTTDANGVAKITTDTLPDNLTTWDIESVVSTADNRIGVGETTVLTTKQVIIDDNLPRFFGASDSVIVAPTVFNKTDADGYFTVTATAKNGTIAKNSKEVFIKNGEQVVVPFEMKVTDKITDPTNTFLDITLSATLRGGSKKDEVEKVMPIRETSTPETVAMVGKTKDVSVDEKILLGAIASKNGELTIRYGATALSNLLSGMDYLSQFPYGCAEQKTSTILPNLLMKKLYTSADKPFDLTKKMVRYWSETDGTYKNISVDEIIKNYLVDIKKFQKYDGGFDYWADVTFKTYSDFWLSSYVLSTVSQARDIGYPIDKSAFGSTVNYLKNRFYINKIEGCVPTKTFDCHYDESDRMAAIEAIIAYDANDYEAYKMWKLLKLQPTSSDRVAELSLLAKLSTSKAISAADVKAIKTRADELMTKILSDEVVVNPRGSFLGKTGNLSRIEATGKFIAASLLLGYHKREDVAPIIDTMNRWIVGEKKNGYFGSTRDTAGVMRSLTTYLEASGELKGVNMQPKLFLNSTLLDEKKIDNTNSLESFSKVSPLADLQSENIFHTEKQGAGTLYYDVALRYYVPTKNLEARDEGFLITQDYFDYNEYRKIEALKTEEYARYMSGDLDYTALKYPKDTVEYLTPVLQGKVGQLLFVHNRIITSEARDKVAFEGFIPSGSELVNTNLATEDQSLRSNTIFDREEFRDDRYFGYTSSLDSGVYSFDYVLRLTHDGTFLVKPSRIFEFYNEEVFGRTAGREVKIVD